MLRRFRRIRDAADLWAALDPARMLFNRPEWLLPAENDGETRYAVHCGEHGAPQAGIAMYRVDGNMFANYDPVEVLLRFPDDARPYADPGDAARLERLQREHAEPLRRALRPAAVSLLPAAYLPGIVRTGDAPEPVARVLDALDETAKEWRAGCTAVMHVPGDDALLGAMLRDRGYVPCLVTAQCVLPVPGRSFDDYLRALKSDRRRKVLRERRVFAESGMKVRWAGAEVLGPEMARLQSEQLGRYGHDVPPERLLGLIEQIKAHLDGSCRVLVAERDDDLEAFVLSYVDDAAIYPKMVGWSAYAQNHYAYFNLGYYEQVAYAAEHGLSQVVVGPESFDAKVPRRCTLHPRVMYVRAEASLMPAVEALAALLDRVHRARLSPYAAALE